MQKDKEVGLLLNTKAASARCLFFIYDAFESLALCDI